jgi:hypothetical protein
MARLYPTKGLTALVAILCLGGCEAAKSANPTAPSVAGPIPGVAITAPRPLEPHAGETLMFSSEPPTLLIENAGTSGVRTLWLQLDVSTDTNFSHMVHQADQITLGPGGRTTYRLPEPLGAGYTYYWRSRAADGANTGPFSAISSFNVVPPVVIDTPTPVEPSGNISTNRPQFKVRNAAISGTTGVVYRFLIATNPEMTNVTGVLSVPPGGNGETTVSLGELPYNTTFYWRVWGTDGTKESPQSNVISFKTPAAPAPVPAPGGGGGVPVGVPRGPGGRTPDPQSGRLPLPGYGFGVVQAVARANPGALANSCQDHGGSWAFLDAVVDTLRTYDTRWGYNGKRGNVNDPSLDVVTYHHGSGADYGSSAVYIIDVIGGHCGAAPSPAWNDVTDATYNGNTIGRWISRGRF